MTDKTPLGYVVCTTCQSPKAIYQGSGRRIKYVFGRCECGLDNRTKPPVQAVMSAYKPLEEVKAELEALNQPVESPPEPLFTPIESDNEPQTLSDSDPQSEVETKPLFTAKRIGIAAAVGLVIGGAIKAVRAVA
ncbi:hypothetical protein [Vibrio algarum]|uniref:Zinc finger Ogr/Delta-type domain-containing protein n=1 Tax=Vibrio algarum TaxID=3020714 RepID=A0ABT4YMR0_9VIBR|nr:hypothetical protein [Vibrio sp. KJ40-1]MDB1122831.1 hypothetical protein [Vibrio sp. KJ40-1]